MKKLGLAILTASVAGVAALSVSQARLPFNVPDRVAMVEAQNPSGSDFNNALHREYLALGQEAFAEHDRIHSRRYLRKGYEAGENANVMPEDPRTWWLLDRSRAELYEMHGRLLSALEDGRSNMPAVAARAQAMYDCWVEEEHEDVWARAPGVPPNYYQPDDVARCRDAFLQALCELEGRCRPHIVHFRFDRPDNVPATQWSRGDLWPGGPSETTGRAVESGAAALDRAIRAALDAPGQRIALEGYTDAVGSSQYNRDLGLRRAQFILSELLRAGATPGEGNIFASSWGEHPGHLCVDTSSREVLNRRVAVHIGDSSSDVDCVYE